MSHRCSRNFWDRREFLFTSGGGISGLALSYLLGRDDLLAAEPDPCSAPATGVNPFAPKPPHHKPRATAVISLFMGGGVEPDGHVRSEARADEVRGRTDRRQGAG